MDSFKLDRKDPQTTFASEKFAGEGSFWSMILGIDASNIRGGGGVTHLLELLRAVNPVEYGISQVIVWGGKTTLDYIEERPWLVMKHEAMLDKSLPYRIFWQRFRLSKLARLSNCNVLFVPGGSYAGDFVPMITMNQNLLPFEKKEMRRFGFSWMIIKLYVLRFIQTRTLQRANGAIFLTQHALEVIMQVIKYTAAETIIVPHGINDLFTHPPRKQLPISRYSIEQPFRILYVSIIDVYKHQWHVAEAVAELRRSGLPVILDLVGPAYPPAMRRLNKTLERIDPKGEFLWYSGSVPYAELYPRYSQADLGLFASSCETFGQIVTEAMSAGLPIACSNRSAMPEVLRDAGVYFDPEKPVEIAEALRKLIENPVLRAEKAAAAFERARTYTWERCARETFAFITKVAKEYC